MGVCVPESIKNSKLLGPLVLACGFGSGWISVNARAQSTQDLEKQVLLGTPSTTPEPAPVEAPPPTDAATSSAESEVPLSVENAPKPVAKEEKSEQGEAIDEAVMGPKEIPADHIFVVQQRYIRKEGRHEVTPAMIGVQLADSFRRQIQLGVSYVYHFSESFGLEALHATFIKNYGTGLNNAIRTSVNLETDRIESVYSIGSALQWTPLRSKAATDGSIYHFEGYFILGGGMTKYEVGSSGMLMYGLGFRSYISREAILKAELRNYSDLKSTSHVNRLTVNLGASVLFGGDQ